MQNWLHDADVRTREYYEGRARGPVTWILVDGKNIPTNIAIPGGEEHGQPHYICRGFHEVSRGFVICGTQTLNKRTSAIRAVFVSTPYASV